MEVDQFIKIAAGGAGATAICALLVGLFLKAKVYSSTVVDKIVADRDLQHARELKLVTDQLAREQQSNAKWEQRYVELVCIVKEQSKVHEQGVRVVEKLVEGK